MGESVWQERLWGTMFGAFAVLALSLAGVGLFGVMSYTVAQQTREIGIRMALGAEPVRVGRMVIRDALVVVGIGAAIGLLASLGVGRVIRHLLHGAPPYDPVVYGTVTLVLVAMSVLAAAVPARRASHVNPIMALRSE